MALGDAITGTSGRLNGLIWPKISLQYGSTEHRRPKADTSKHDLTCRLSPSIGSSIRQGKTTSVKSEKHVRMLVVVTSLRCTSPGASKNERDPASLDPRSVANRARPSIDSHFHHDIKTGLTSCGYARNAGLSDRPFVPHAT
jgi:hypothetical protein